MGLESTGQVPADLHSAAPWPPSIEHLADFDRGAECVIEPPAQVIICVEVRADADEVLYSCDP
jgi:hypothetical protein